MKAEFKILMFCLISLSINSFGQLKIVNTGSVGIGTDVPFVKLHVQGDVMAVNYFNLSDSTYKKNITPLRNCSAIIKQLNCYKYQFTNVQNGSNIDNYNYGLLAQELERVMPDLVSKTTPKAVNYIGLIPVLIESLKEQQKLIEESNRKIDSLSVIVSSCCAKKEEEQSNQQSSNNNNSIGNPNIEHTSSKGKLYQNTPNPFNGETKIEYELSNTSKSASIAIFDLQGNFKKSYPLDLNKSGSIIILAGELTQGMYIYTLIIDHQEVDSKRMILIN
ncbi:MAG: hypothetical protein JWO44_530 [Bacteroidetes bacterium]|nr:hypothetical protein [Bacteroidota bacterium]